MLVQSCTRPPASLRLISNATAMVKTRFYSSSETVPLAFDLHSPLKAKDGDQKKAPIIFMHGLFGSKKNNRSISK